MPILLCIDIDELGTKSLCYPLHILLVLACIESAGGVYQQSAVIEAWPYVFDDGALQVVTVDDILYAPLADGILVFAKHALARARHVGENDIKLEFRLPVVLGVIVCDDDFLMPLLLNVLHQDVGTLVVWFVAEEQASLRQSRASQGRLATGSGTKVEHCHGTCHLLTQHLIKKHTCRFLYVIATCVKQRIEREVGLFIEPHGIPAPWHLLSLEILARFERVEPH